MMDWAPFWLTFKLAGCTTVLLLIAGIPLAYYLAFTKSKWRIPLQTLVSMPLVLPPSVLGFYLLIAFSPKFWFGAAIESWFDVRLAFSFTGLLIGSFIFSLPFMVNPLRTGFGSVHRSLIEAAQTLGKSRGEILYRVLLPNMRPAVVSASIMTFAHTVGEFGVVLMIGGSIPEKTKVASIALFEAVEQMNYSMAHTYVLVLVIFSWCVLFGIHVIESKNNARGR